MSRLRIVATALVIGAASVTALAPAATAHPTRTHHAAAERVWLAGAGQSSATPSRLGATTVTTARGVAGTLLAAGVAPLPVLPSTGFRLGLGDRTLRASYTFPITSSTADLAAGTGDILHSGGIYFASLRAHLEIGKFDIDLAAGKVFATEVNFAPARIAVLDLDLSGLQISTRGGSTVLTGIGAGLDPQAATALNSTFGLALPTAAPLLNFGRARVVLN